MEFMLKPVTMGMKWLLWHDLLKRAKKRLEDAKKKISVGKISGVVGTYAQVPPEIERHVCDSLGLTPDTLSTQVISRTGMRVTSLPWECWVCD